MGRIGLIVEYSRMQLPSLSSGCEIAQFYAPQTKILELRTNLSGGVFETIFKDSSPKSSTHALEKCFENTFGKVGSAFQNLRLGAAVGNSSPFLTNLPFHEFP
jgi:hypothetical protein